MNVINNTLNNISIQEGSEIEFSRLWVYTNYGAGRL
jgi:hypothetical protein